LHRSGANLNEDEIGAGEIVFAPLKRIETNRFAGASRRYLNLFISQQYVDDGLHA
jgi:hypothetical protein